MAYRLLLRTTCALMLSIFTAGSAHVIAANAQSPPNVVFILCDDLGYGDVRCLNKDGKIATPQLDKLAAEGMIFTDAHSGSSVCSPTRYGVLTGRYAWRSPLKSSVLGGLSPRLIEPSRMTVASFLKDHGYHTACIGKWHLGMNWVKKPGMGVSELGIESAAQVNNVEYDKPVADGPTSVGFDYYFGISASLDMVPYTFIENDHVVVSPTATAKFPMMPGKAGMTREGPAAPGFTAEDVLPTLTRRAIEYVESRVATKQPFFLYLPLASPHTPIAPSTSWQGKSGLNPYADFVMETDDAIGRLLKTLDERGLAKNTLVIVTSDNGCSPQADFSALAEKGHNPSYVFRGHKADIFDGGHRVPFLVRWPARVKAGSTTDQLTCLGDLFATCADILQAKLPDNAGEDSYSFLPAPTGEKGSGTREAIVHHSINGSFSIRRGPWKLEFCGDSGGWSAPKPNSPAANNLPPLQLYNLTDDIGETKNLAEQEPKVVAELTALLEQYVDNGRSTPGTKQENTTPVEYRKAAAPARKAKTK